MDQPGLTRLAASDCSLSRAWAAEAGFTGFGSVLVAPKREADRNHHGPRSRPDFDRRLGGDSVGVALPAGGQCVDDDDV
jgi:hypothetical protein